MFKPLRMQHAMLWVLRSDAPQAALMLATYGIFTPEKSRAWERDLPETPGDRYLEVYAEAQARLTKILAHYGHDQEEAEEPKPVLNRPAGVPTPDAPSLEELSGWNDWLGELWNVASECDEDKRRHAEALERTQNLMRSVEHFRALDIDLGWLVRPKRFLHTRVGTVKQANIPRLREALELSGYLLEAFDEQDGRVYAVIAGPVGREAEVRGAIDAAGWQEITLEPEMLAHPEQVKEKLLQRTLELQGQIEQCNARHFAKLGDVQGRLGEIERGMILAEPYARISSETLRARGGLALITGWIAERDVASMRQALDARLSDRYVLQLRTPLASERDEVPSSMRYPIWLGPFATLVRNYGIPRYGEFDPTWLFAISFVLMFGMMFGDVGQGLVIVFGGLLLRGKARAFRSLFVSAGFSSVGFGFAYGSLFGFETVVEPLWVSPLHDPEGMLKAAVYWGIGFITVTQLLTIYNRMISGELSRALFEAGGVAGLALYLGAAKGILSVAEGGSFGYAPMFAALAGLAIIAVRNWLESEGALFERLLTVAIESFESVTGFFSNTLSFMRVAAFSINHVALALAVFTIAESLGGAGRWITIVVGNVIILGLEGAIVAIQVLRLEYYEGFSRFYSGSGRASDPLTIGRARMGNKLHSNSKT